jgi:hypothetical protein
VKSKLLPEGWYTGTIKKAQVKSSERGEYMMITFDVRGHDVKNYFSPRAASFWFQFLRILGRKRKFNDVSKRWLIKKKAKLYLKIERYENKEFNRFKI